MSDIDDVVLVSVDRGVATVTFNRPAKRNAMNPALNARMLEVLDEIEADDKVGVVVLTGAGQSWSAGMDLKEYFRDNDGKPRAATLKARRQSGAWWQRLMFFEKPTIAMVNGWCFGGAFTPLVACDLAIAAEEAQFGLSEINWGILPGGNVTRAVAEVMRHRDVDDIHVERTEQFVVVLGPQFDGRHPAKPFEQVVLKVAHRSQLGGHREVLEDKPTTERAGGFAPHQSAADDTDPHDWFHDRADAGISDDPCQATAGRARVSER